jgi:myo-inositol-1(or 4)-monophosphatase
MSDEPTEPQADTGLAAELLHVAKQAAEAGAEVLIKRDAAILEASNKSADGDWVTAFDIAAEQAIRRIISQSRPHDAITGEEFGTTVPAGASGIRWAIDPLDGTTNFIRNIVYYATSVAVVDSDGEWLAGVVNAPALGRVYWAHRGGGAWLEEHARDGHTTLRRLSGPVPGRKGRLLGTGFSYDRLTRRQQVGALLPLMKGFADVRRIGSAALDLCMVADGTLDVYAERGLNEHDWAAGALIAEEAGAWVHRPNLTSALEGGPTEPERLAAVTAAGLAAEAETFGLVPPWT